MIKQFLIAALVGGLALAASLVPTSALAEDWQVDQSASSIGFSGTHAGRDFTGVFEDWRAEISFDPAALNGSAVVVEVMTASAKTGTLLYDKTLPNSEWFAAEAHPVAVFRAQEFSQVGDGQYQAEGSLTIKGQEVPLMLPFSLEIEGETARMTGAVEMDRIALQMGTKSDPDAAWVSQIIPVEITLTATRLP